MLSKRVVCFAVLLAACGSEPPPAVPETSPAPVVVVEPVPEEPGPAKPPPEPAPEVPTQIGDAVCPLPDSSDPVPDCPSLSSDPLGTARAKQRANDADQAIRTLRAGAPGAKSARLLDAEVAALEQLLKVTQKSAPDRPLVALRLCVSMGHRATLAPAVRQGLDRARTCYEGLIKDHPSFDRIDEAYYGFGFVHEQIGDLQGARKTYFELIRRYPRSDRVPAAYFAFGELFFHDAAADPSKLPLAERAFEEVVSYPPPANPLYAAAHYRLALVHQRSGMHQKALMSAVKGLEATRDKDTALRLALIEALAQSYAEAGRADRVCPFVARFTGTSRERLTAIDSIAAAYGRRGDREPASLLYHSLSRADHGADYCSYQAALHTLARK